MKIREDLRGSAGNPEEIEIEIEKDDKDYLL